VDLESGSGEDRRLAPGMFSVNADGGEFRRLVRRRERAFISDGSLRDDRALEWNHVLLQVPLAQDGVKPDEVVIGELVFGRDRLRAIRPLWLDTRTVRTRPVDVGEAPADVVGWMFDSKGEARLAETRGDGRIAFHWRGPGDRSWRRIFEGDALKMPFMPHAVADDGTLWVTYPEGPEGYSVLTRFDFGKLAPAEPPLVRAPGFDFRGELVLSKAGSRALGVRVDTDAESTVWFDAAMKALQASVDEKLPGRVNEVRCRRCGQPDMVALVRSYADRDPGHLVLYEAATKRWQRVAAMLDDIDPKQMAPLDLHRIKARDGRDLPVWVTLPPGVPAGRKAPAVVLVHGGPWVRGGFWRWEPLEQFLASRGYLVISPEYRGSTGYGSAHYVAGWRQWGQAMQDDVADALQWAQARGLADERACIAGYSYGGYSALMGLVRHPDLYRCGIAAAAPTDLFLLLEGSWWVDDDASRELRQYSLPELIGDATNDAAMLKANSPLAQAARIQAPLLLAYGESDRRVPLAHGERLRSALKSAGRPPEWVSYANEGHSWRLTATQVDFARRLETFLARHLGR
jgi:acetyl esterase/lipase